MPQLNPNPWFSTMVITWLALVFLFMTKLLLSPPFNPPLNLNQPTSTPNWNWPWT
uniref:ATP synthase complex subunit 8 n=1 Tax=Varanus exanthematicus TaxID=8557 RepID=A0A7R7J3Y3_VAREA|nr:ATP synthase F0 subunit 8 [Varanus exanthematicus]